MRSLTVAPWATSSMRSCSSTSSWAMVASPVAQDTPRRCQLQLFAMVGEQLRAVLALQVRDVLGDGRLGERQLLSGSGVVQSAAHGEECLYAKILHCVSFDGCGGSWGLG